MSPDYIKFLSRKGYLKEQAFLRYLEYLLYWKEPEYLKLLQQPNCIDVLEMLLEPEVREEIAENEDFANLFAF